MAACTRVRLVWPLLLAGLLVACGDAGTLPDEGDAGPRQDRPDARPTPDRPDDPPLEDVVADPAPDGLDADLPPDLTTDLVGDGPPPDALSPDAITDGGDLTPQAPRVLITKPPDGRVGVGTGAHVVFTFSETMEATTLTAQAEDGPCSGTVQLSADDFVTCVGGVMDNTTNPIVYFTPGRELDDLTRYFARVSSAARSAEGLELDRTFTHLNGFRTGPRTISCRILYTTGMAYQASTVGGITGADAACDADPARPGTVSFAQALIVDRTHRIACTIDDCAGSLQLEWVLAPRTCYVRPDGDFVFETNPYGIVTSSSLAGPLSDEALGFWSGLTSGWITDSGSTCDDWSAVATGGGSYGEASATDRTWIAAGSAPCDDLLALVCAEQ